MAFLDIFRDGRPERKTYTPPVRDMADVIAMQSIADIQMQHHIDMVMDMGLAVKAPVDIAPALLEPSFTVEEIHRGFNEASDEDQTRSRIEIDKLPAEDPTVKLKRELGFSAAAGVHKASNADRVREMALKRISTVDYYKERYPLHKFIHADNVEKLCEKYGLVFGEAYLYIGDVPMKNLKEMKAFKDLKPVREEDQVYVAIHGDRHSYYGEPRYYDKETYATISEQHNEWGSVRKTGICDHFFICAPQKEMDMRHRRVNSRYQVVSEVRPPDDPVVLYRVKEGFLIVTAWGPEASDPQVLNEIHN